MTCAAQSGHEPLLLRRQLDEADEQQCFGSDGDSVCSRAINRSGKRAMSMTPARAVERVKASHQRANAAGSAPASAGRVGPRAPWRAAVAPCVHELPRVERGLRRAGWIEQARTSAIDRARRSVPTRARPVAESAVEACRRCRQARRHPTRANRAMPTRAGSAAIPRSAHPRRASIWRSPR